MFGADNLFNTNVGSFEGTSGSVSVIDATTAGNAVLIIAGIGGDNISGHNKGFTTPSGFTAISAAADGPEYAKVYVWIKPSSAGGETSWTLDVSGGTEQVAWFACELTEADLDWSQKAYLNAGRVDMAFPAGAAISSQTSNTTGVSESYSALALAASFVTNTTPSAPTVTWSNDFYEIATSPIANGTRAHNLSIAVRPTQVVGTIVTTASVSPDSYMCTWLGVFTGLDSYHAPNILGCFGAEIGTATSITSTDPTGGPAPFDTATAGITIDTAHPRSGNYAMKLTATAAACNATWEQKTFPAKGVLGSVSVSPLPEVLVRRMHFYFEDLPSGDLPLYSFEVGSLANGLVIRYVSASQAIGVKIGGGTERVSSAISADQYVGVDIRYDPRTTTHVCDWAVDYNANVNDVTPGVAQTQASTSGMTAGGVSVIRWGWTDSSTGTVWMDDDVATKYRKNYPLGDLRVVPLKVDPAGTPTVSGTSTNFEVFTSNGGTRAAFSAAGCRAALDDVPPTIGASSDGLTQIAVATSDYVEVPMEPYICAPDFSPVGGRWYWAGWAASGNPASIKFKAHDGVGTFSAQGSDDPAFDNSTLVWMTYLHNPVPAAAYPFTETKVDGLAARFGFSPDANPDAGVHCVLFELVTKPADVIGIIDCETGAFTVYGRINPVTQAIVSFLVTTPAGDRGATFTHSLAGVAQDPHYVNPNTTYELSIGADDITGVTAYGLSPDPA